jgi:hypothetical protein
MSTLWTPDGERPIRREGPAAGSGQPAGGGPGGGRPPAGDDPAAESEAMAAQLDQLRDQLAKTPAAEVVANHAFGLFELAALHLSLQPPQLDQAQVAIDALAALVDGMQGRLGEPEAQLREGLAQLRIAYVQIKSANNPS